MKKVLTIAVVMAMGAGVAFAGTIVAPWFLDAGANDGALGSAADANKVFIRMRNNTATDITITVAYVGPNAGNQDISKTPNTFLLKKGAVTAWRPYGVDTGAGDSEGGIVGGKYVQRVPNSSGKAGAAVMTWPGGSSTDVTGSLTSGGPNGTYGMALTSF